MPRFPSETIRATGTEYAARSGPTGLASITVTLASFEFDGETFDTSLRCDEIELDLADPGVLAGRSFDFPPNPEPGYIDGSVYLFHVHVFFITSRLTFGQVTNGTLPLTIEGTLEFANSGLPQYEDAELVVQTELRLPTTHA